MDERPVLRDGQPVRPGAGEERRAATGNVVVFSATAGRPGPAADRQAAAAARRSTAQPLPLDAPADRRERLADWLVSRDNPYFARAIANRVWANFFGVGLVEAVDDMRETNPASNEALLTALADHLVDQKFDLKALMRAILQSDTYQRSSAAARRRTRPTGGSTATTTRGG